MAATLSAADRVTWRVGVPKEALGTVIGRGGMTIRKMEAETHSTMTIRLVKAREQEKVVTITASLNECIAAVAAVVHKIADALKYKNPNIFNEMVVSVLIPNDALAHTYAEIGSAIDAIGEVTDTHLAFTPHNAFSEDPNECEITVRGPIDKCILGAQRFMSVHEAARSGGAPAMPVLTSAPATGALPAAAAEPSLAAREQDLRAQLRARQEGKSGVVSPEPAAAAPPPPPPPPSHGSAGRPATSAGSATASAKAKAGVSPDYAASDRPAKRPATWQEDERELNSASGGSNGNEASPSVLETEEWVNAFLPPSVLRVLLHNNQEYLRRIISLSHATITLTDSSEQKDSNADRAVTVRGTPAQQWTAQQLFYELLLRDKPEKTEAVLDLELWVDRAAVPKLVGTRGSMIAEIKTMCQCHVAVSFVSEVDPSMPVQAVAVRGNFEQSQMAQQRVREIIWKAKQEMARGYLNRRRH